MSIQAVAWVLDQSRAEGMDRLVLISIANHHNESTGIAYPGIDVMAAEARVHRATVIRAIERLEKLGEIIVTRPEKRGRGRVNRYRMTFQTAVDNDSGNVADTATISVDNDPVDNQERLQQAPLKGRNEGSKRLLLELPESVNQSEPRGKTSHRATNHLSVVHPATPTRCSGCGELELNCDCTPTAPPPRDLLRTAMANARKPPLAVVGQGASP